MSATVEEAPEISSNQASGSARSPASSDSAPMNIAALGDGEIAAVLTDLAKGTGEVLVVANGYTVCLFCRNGSTHWQRLCTGEFSNRSITAARSLGGRIAWARVDGFPWEADPSDVPTQPATPALLRSWLKNATALTAGRKGEVTSHIRDELPYLAGWRCQFEGCGRDLRLHTASGARGRFSYFAHIVAASPDGPRGDSVLSPQLASDLSNFMLLCDECHRLVDKIHPARFTAETLRRMRENSIAEVRRLLDTLQYPSTEVIGILGNIAGQPAQISTEDVHEALWGSKLRTSSPQVSRYFSPGGQHHDVHSPAYWSSLFQQLHRDLPLLQTLLEGTRTGTARPRLAIFPLHSTSVLLLAGRVLGDAAGTHLFQPHRNAVGEQTRWAWRPDQSAPATDKFRVSALRSSNGEDSACLVVALTSDIGSERIPPSCAGLPTLRITGPTFEKDCIQHPDDLRVLGRAVDEAMRQLQDEWRVRTVNLFVSAPASAVVVVGQKMQARHHADYVVHEALVGPGAAYRATIQLTPTLVRELASGQDLSLSLQP